MSWINLHLSVNMSDASSSAFSLTTHKCRLTPTLAQSKMILFLKKIVDVKGMSKLCRFSFDRLTTTHRVKWTEVIQYTFLK